MTSFIIRQIDPDFWARVRAKAAAEGVTVKTLILRLLTAWLAAVVVLGIAGCGYKNPTAPTLDTPAVSTAAASIQLLGASRKDGLVDVTAVVLTKDGHFVPDASVSFTASVGSITPDVAQTDATGRATALLTATEPSTVTVTSGDLRASAKIISSLPSPIPEPAPQPFPPVPPVPGPSPSYSATLSASPSVFVVPGSSTLTASAVATNGAPAPTAFAWDCRGAGTVDATTTTPTHVCTYGSTGTFSPNVRISGGTAVATAFTTVTVTAIPQPGYSVSLTASPQSVVQNGSATLTATATPTNGAPAPTTYAWDCNGDGTPEVTNASTSQVCPYGSTVGSVTSKVVVSTGAATGTGSTTVSVTAAAPLAVAITASTSTPAVGASMTFTGTVSSTGPTPTNALQWEWDFGDGASGTTLIQTGTTPQTANFAGYGSTGVKTIKLKVTDTATGRTAIGTRTVTVQ